MVIVGPPSPAGTTADITNYDRATSRRLTKSSRAVMGVRSRVAIRRSDGVRRDRPGTNPFFVPTRRAKACPNMADTGSPLSRASGVRRRRRSECQRTPGAVSLGIRRRARTLSAPKIAGHALWYSVAEPFRAKEWTPRWTPNATSPRQILKPDLVSVLVPIFRPDGVDLVDFRDFRDCSSSRVSDWESVK